MAERQDPVRAHVEVRLWDETLGAAVELASGRILFEYAEAFRRRGIEPSPLHLPLARAGPQSFEELARKPAFLGLPGLLADALPDAFGNRVIRAWFAARGREQEALSPVQRLLYLGERALGALSFHPALALESRAAEAQALELAGLVRDARAIVAGRTDLTASDLYRVGGSAGGLRPKALVLWDGARRRLRAGDLLPEPGEAPCLLKFDGVGDGASADQLGLPQAFNRVELTYMQLAREAGLDVAEVELLEDGDHAHLLVRRFDREAGQRWHQHSFGGLLHLDYNEPGVASYEEFLRTILALGLPQASVEEGWRRALFNVLAVNQDDHVKNLSFLMSPDGRWRLAPAYDLTFARGQGWTRVHQMRVADKTAGITAQDLLAVAGTFGIKRPQRHLAKVRAALDRFDERAESNGVPAATRAVIVTALEERAAQLGA